MLPPFDPDTGRLPEGEHAASWDEIVDRFGWTPRRRQLLDGLAHAIELLAAAGCSRLWLNGSFVTAKDDPRRLRRLLGPRRGGPRRTGPGLPRLRVRTSPPEAQFGGEFFPNVIETGSGLDFADFFQNERDGGRKGIVILTLKGLS